MSTLLDPPTPDSSPDPTRGPGATPEAEPARAAKSPKPTSGGWFRAFWRWHFYASFLVAPILLILATTGAIYLLRFEVEPVLHADTMTVERPDGAMAPFSYDVQQKAVAKEYPSSTIVSMTEPSEEGRATVFTTTTKAGTPLDVYVDPWTAKVTGAINPDTTLSGTAVRIHADLMAGRFGDTIIEIAVCWAIVMALTGYYLFFKGRAARRRSRAKSARLRRSHARIGVFAGFGVLMLIVSGLPWTGFWGTQAQELAAGQGSSLWSLDHGAQSRPTSTLDESLPHSHAVPWAQGKTERPESEATDEDGQSIANVDTAVTVADRAGLRHPMTVAMPADDKGTFSVIGYAFDAPSDEKTVHIDRFGGQIVSTYGYDDYPRLAKVVSQGIGLHEGRSLGLWSFWFALLTCLAVIASCVTGPLMWWKRRPSGSDSVGAPRGRLAIRGSKVLLLGLVALGIFLPYFGISLLLVLLLDKVVLRRVPRFAHWFDSVPEKAPAKAAAGA